MGGTGDVAGLAVLQGQAGHGVLGERVAIPQMKRTHPAGSGGEAESVNTEWGGFTQAVTQSDSQQPGPILLSERSSSRSLLV